jgi:hypothetical protein
MAVIGQIRVPSSLTVHAEMTESSTSTAGFAWAATFA